MQPQVVLCLNLIIMKILIILLLVTVFFATIEVSYSQMIPLQQVENIHKVLLQLQLRNSDDQLVSYVEGTKILRINPDLLNQHLDSFSSNKTISIDGKNYELFQWQGRTETLTRTHSMAMFILKILVPST